MPVFFTRITHVNRRAGAATVRFSNGRSVKIPPLSPSAPDLLAAAERLRGTRQAVFAHAGGGALITLSEPILGRVIWTRYASKALWIGLHTTPMPFRVSKDAASRPIRSVVLRARRSGKVVGLWISDKNEILGAQMTRMSRPFAGESIRNVNVLPKRAPAPTTPGTLKKGLSRITRCPMKPESKPPGCIPFYAFGGGCQARAHATYQSLAPAIECGKIWCFPRSKSIQAMTTEGVKYPWAFHVAVVVKTSSPSGEKVIDWGLFELGEGTVSEWKRALGKHRYFRTSAAPYMIERRSDNRWRLTFDRQGNRTEKALEEIRDLG